MRLKRDGTCTIQESTFSHTISEPEDKSSCRPFKLTGLGHLHMDGFLPEVGGGGGGMLLPVRYDSGESPWLSVDGVDLAQLPSVVASHSVLLCADAAAALLFGVYTDMGR